MALSDGYIAGALGAKIVRVSGTTLFHLAAEHLGDAMRWTDLAEINGLVDPWVVALAEIKIPPVVDKSVTPTGILGA